MCVCVCECDAGDGGGGGVGGGVRELGVGKGGYNRPAECPGVAAMRCAR